VITPTDSDIVSLNQKKAAEAAFFFDTGQRVVSAPPSSL
jgi:hypothetical protein